MLKSYVALITRNGLQAFLPEREHVVRELVRSAYQDPGRRALCCWAVIPDTAALEVARQMDEGDHHAALLTLDRAATTLGPILPSNADGRTRFGGRDCR
jgi:hypothetical protein